MDEETLLPEDERRLLNLFEQSSLHDYPNPEREDCPGTPFLRKLAADRKSIPIDHPDLTHVTHCSPCFREFIDFRQQVRHRKRLDRAAAFVGIILAIGLTVYFATSGRGRFRTQSNGAAEFTAKLDLKDFVVLRGLPETNTPALTGLRELRRGRLALTVTLPLASAPGDYEFEVLREPGKPLAFAKGEAQNQNGLTTVFVRLDLSAILPGGYFWGIRRDSQEWAYCPVRVIE